jgi:hypothetical protein
MRLGRPAADSATRGGGAAVATTLGATLAGSGGAPLHATIPAAIEAPSRRTGATVP